MKRDYYEVLGIARSATEAEIKTAYRRAAAKHHPDRNPGNEAAAEIAFKEVKEAYEVLSDSGKRRAYDQHGHAAFEHGMGGGGAGGGYADVGDIFGDIFGNIFGGGMGGGQRPRRGADIGYRLDLDLEEAVSGLTRRIELPTLAECDDCHGSGSEDGKLDTCSHCHGRGQIIMQRGPFRMQQTCPHCAGRGQTIAKPCKSCHGNGRVEKEKTLEVTIPAGVDTGDRIALRGEGEAGPAGTPPGDLYIEVRVREHAIFTREGDDLHCEIPIRISQAALGDTVRVPTLKGEAEIRIPAETQSGKVFRLRGKGVKSVRSRSEGDLYCTVNVETPVNLTSEQRELLEKFEATFVGEGARKHSPRHSTFMDGVKSFWDRMTG